MTTTPDPLSLLREFYAQHQDFTVARRRAKAGSKRGYPEEDAVPLRELLPGYAEVVGRLEAYVASVAAPGSEFVTAAELGRRLVTEAQEVLGQYDAAKQR